MQYKYLQHKLLGATSSAVKLYYRIYKSFYPEAFKHLMKLNQKCTKKESAQWSGIKLQTASLLNATSKVQCDVIEKIIQSKLTSEPMVSDYAVEKSVQKLQQQEISES